MTIYGYNFNKKRNSFTLLHLMPENIRKAIAFIKEIAFMNNGNISEKNLRMPYGNAI